MDGEFLYQGKGYFVDAFSSSVSSSRATVTFTEFGSRRCDGYGFAGEFLLKNGFDVVAVKSVEDRWYQDFPDEALSQIKSYLTRKQYPHVGAYGSSMGGYAAMTFAEPIGCNVALAISPQYDITQAWDTRWAKWSLPSGMRQPVFSVGNACTYWIVYDPDDKDREHAERYKLACPGVKAINARYSGHPSGYHLQSVGLLKELALTILRGDTPGNVSRRLRQSRRSAAGYYFRLAQRCFHRRKYEFAAGLIKAALGLKVLDAEYYILAAQIAERQGVLVDAVTYASTAVALNPAHSSMNATLARILKRAGKAKQALHYIETALSISPSSSYLLSERDNLMGMLRAKQETLPRR